MSRAARLSLGAALLACAVVCAALAALRPAETLAEVNALRAAAAHSGATGAAIFAVAQTLIALSGVLPAALLGAAAGAVFGVSHGFALAAASTLIGAELSFLASRTLMRDFAERALASRPRVRAFDALVAREGLRFVCLLRLSPVMPFAATSYALGLTSVSARDYAIGTLAALPALFGYVVTGALAGAGLAAWSSDAGLLRLAMLAVGVVATLALTLKIGALARRIAAAAETPPLGAAS